MDPFALGGIGIGLVLLFLVMRVPIAFALGAVAAGCTFVFYAWPVGRDRGEPRQPPPSAGLESREGTAKDTLPTGARSGPQKM